MLRSSMTTLCTILMVWSFSCLKNHNRILRETRMVEWVQQELNAVRHNVGAIHLLPWSFATHSQTLNLDAIARSDILSSYFPCSVCSSRRLLRWAGSNVARQLTPDPSKSCTRARRTHTSNLANTNTSEPKLFAPPQVILRWYVPFKNPNLSHI